MQDARCLKVKPRERAFKQFKSPVFSVLKRTIDVPVQIIFNTLRSFAAVTVHRTILLAILLVCILNAILKLQFFVVNLIS